MVNVPSQYQPYVNQAATGTGLPEKVVAAQANEESGFQSNSVSSTGALGWLQFEPSTYNAYAAQAGVPENTETNVADETKVYIVYMNSLLKQEGGNIFKALEAYNAGPGNLAAGANYASVIESNAGVSQSATAGNEGSNASPTAATTDAFTIPGLGSINPVGIAGDIMSAGLKAFGLSSFKDAFQRLGLILLGVALLIVGIRIISQGNSGSSKTVTTQSDTDEDGSTTKKRTVNTPVSRHTKTVRSGATKEAGASEVGAGEALEAAAIA